MCVVQCYTTKAGTHSPPKLKSYIDQGLKRFYCPYFLPLCLQYEDGVLVIRNGNKAYVPAGQFSAETVSQEDDDEDEHELFWWHWLLIGLAGAVLVLAVFFVAFVSSCTLSPSTVGHV